MSRPASRSISCTLAVGLAGIALAGAAPAAADTFCVGSAPGCLRTIQAALDASHDGDTIAIRAGTFAGGVHVETSVRLVGAGAGATRVRGGGPVVTVGTLGDATPPTVTIADLTITGGRTRDGIEGEPFRALGGGVLIPPGLDGAVGAAVTIRDSVIAGNRALPRETVTPDDDGPQCPGPVRCPYAEGDGGGIASFGTLTLDSSEVRDNEAGGPIASDAKGGGVYSAFGALTVTGSELVRNRADVRAPNGRFAEGGALLVESDAAGVAIRDSAIDGNRIALTSDLPAFVGDELVDVQAHAGGVLIGDSVPATIERTRITGNVVTGSAPAAQAIVYDAALHVLDTPIAISDTVITGNRVRAETLTTDDSGPMGTAVELDGGGTLDHVRIAGNPVVADAVDGLSQASSGLAVFDFTGTPDPTTLTDSTIAGNSVLARSSSGAAAVTGAGVLNNSLLDLHRTTVAFNVGTAAAPTGIAQGGGIWNGVLLSGPPVELSLTDSLVTANALFGGPGIERAGGGLWTSEAVTRARTPIVGNLPDQVAAPAVAARRTVTSPRTAARGR